MAPCLSVSLPVATQCSRAEGCLRAPWVARDTPLETGSRLLAPFQTRGAKGQQGKGDRSFVTGWLRSTGPAYLQSFRTEHQNSCASFTISTAKVHHVTPRTPGRRRPFLPELSLLVKELLL